MNSKMNSKMKISDKANILASRDKHSVVRSFQDTFKEDLKISKQRTSRRKASEDLGTSSIEFGARAIAVPYDADKLAKDAGGKTKNSRIFRYWSYRVSK
jgi:hypothetical protein